MTISADTANRLAIAAASNAAGAEVVAALNSPQSSIGAGTVTNAITSAMAGSGSDTALVRATTIDDANWEIAAAGTLRVTSAVGATQPACTVYVTCIRVV